MIDSSRKVENAERRVKTSGDKKNLGFNAGKLLICRGRTVIFRLVANGRPTAQNRIYSRPIGSGEKSWEKFWEKLWSSADVGLIKQKSCTALFYKFIISSKKNGRRLVCERSERQAFRSDRIWKCRSGRSRLVAGLDSCFGNSGNQAESSSFGEWLTEQVR